jgi:hypothetical protein
MASGSVRSYKTAVGGSAVSLNGGEGRDVGSVADSASVWSFVTAEEA